MRTRTMMLTGAVTAIAAVSSLTTQANAQSKEEKYQAMIGIAQQMQELKPQISKSDQAAALYSQLLSAYTAASESFGGDDPGRVFALRPMEARGQTPSEPAHREEGGIAGSTVIPPGCVADSNLSSTAAVPLAIPDVSTVTATITKSGITGHVWYIDSIINITHTFAGDLDITLTSPAGTTVTITTDNGGGNDNVFSSTFFRDNANPGGVAPYATNNGLVTDHAYVNLTAATPLVPEEPFNAFYGEDPNGIWTLTITDDTAVDIGTLNFWDLLVITTSDPSSQTTRTFVNTAPVAIPDLGVTNSSVNVTNLGGYVCDLDVRLNITHSFTGDLNITLTSPSGRTATVSSRNGSSNDDVFAGTVFDNKASPGADGSHLTTDSVYASLVAKIHLTPEESFGGFRGEPANGIWTLTVADQAGGDIGTLNAWGITITTCSCGPSCPGDINGDGVTNVADLLGVIALWGNCP